MKHSEQNINSNESVESDLGLAVRGLTLMRGERLLLEDASFAVPAGSICFLKGDNGAGKTSLMRCLAGVAMLEKGDVFWGDNLSLSSSNNIQDEHKHNYHGEVLFLAHKLAMKPEMTVSENLQFYQELRNKMLAFSAHSHGISEQQEPQYNLDNALGVVGLQAYNNQLFAELSAGQQHKVALCRLLLEPSRLWILDEPFVNLDAKTRLWLVDELHRFKARAGVVIFTSHQEEPELEIDFTIDLSAGANADDGELA